MTNHNDKWNFEAKMKVFGINHNNYKKEIEKYPIVRIKAVNLQSIYNWCQENLGNKWIWSAPIHTDYVELRFINEIDATLFKLRCG